MAKFYKFIIVAAVSLANFPLSATELYNIDFTSSGPQSYQTIFGNPTVQSSVGPLTDALVFRGVTSYDQILLPMGSTSPRYNIQCDVLTHNLLNSQYAFSILLDTPEVRTVDFHGGTDGIDVFQPDPYTCGNVGGFSDDQVCHIEVCVDLEANWWSVAADGTRLFTNPFNASSLQSIRFNMSPWITGATDAPSTYAALDNVTVVAVPEPSSSALFLSAIIICLAYPPRFHTKRN